MHKAFPAVSALQLVASSSREYEESFTQVGMELFSERKPHLQDTAVLLQLELVHCTGKIELTKS
jgi:hypothetical protein